MTPPAHLPDPAPFRRALLRWYRRNRRDLPWRRSHDPYAVLVSEFMLQQTQVSAVIPYYERFLRRFPTPAALAAAPEQEVLRLWAGLGYYRRARQLQTAAQRAVHDHAGRIPSRYEDLLALPGVGPYTAAAVASIAFGQPCAVVDGNVIRVLCRLLAFGDNPRSGSAAARVQEAAQILLAPRAAGDFNQAMMELGALVCRPASPQCPACPVRALCRAYALGRQESFPVPAQRPETVVVREWAPLILRNGRLLMLQRPPGGPWAGMWEAPHVPSLPGESPRDGLARAARLVAGMAIEPAEPAFTVASAFTHHRIEIHCALARPLPGAPHPPDRRPARWVALTQAARLPLASAQRRIVQKMIETRDSGTSGLRASERLSTQGASVAVPKPQNPVVRAALALIWRRGRVLTAVRPASAELGGYREFPGGKINPGETPAQAAVREAREEAGLDITLTGARPLIRYDYPRFTVELHPFDATAARGRPTRGARWSRIEDLLDHDFPPATASLLAQLRSHLPAQQLP